MAEPPRPYAQRKRDALARLENDVDAWVASASADGAANLAPLSYHWDGTALTFAAPRASHTARNLLRSGRARVAVGTTRDVVLLEGAAAELPRGEDVELEDAVGVQDIDRAHLGHHVGRDLRHDLVEPGLRADRLRHDLAEST